MVRLNLPVLKDVMNQPEELPVIPEGLVYVHDDMPGITRKKRGKAFVYLLPDGSRITDEAELARIRKLAIPPAYGEVWICPVENGHLQATARDARGRKQYVYHPDWRQHRDETKFDRMLEFGHALPEIRTRIKQDLDASTGSQVTRQIVIATVVSLLDRTLIRIGNDEYARSNGTYGLTTLRKRHVKLEGSRLRLHFKGKSGVVHEVSLQDRRIARILKKCQTLPGQELFKYLDDDGTLHSIGSREVNEYLREASGGEFTAKDFRTWHASVQALELWQQSRTAGDVSTETVKKLLSEVAKSLGNTVAVCRKSYIHPRVLAFITGEHMSAADLSLNSIEQVPGLTSGEQAFLAVLGALECTDSV